VVDPIVARSFHPGMNCIFCRIISGEAPAKVFYQDDRVIVFYDRSPLTSLHLLVCPKEHFKDFMDAPPETHAMLIETVKKVVTELGDKAKDFRVMINNGPRSGQTVFHLHYHIMAK
jgi:histidine triad (HIT) family protein